MLEDGSTKDDLGLPRGTDDSEKLAVQIKEEFDSGKELILTVLKVCRLLVIRYVCTLVGWATVADISVAWACAVIACMVITSIYNVLVLTGR